MDENEVNEETRTELIEKTTPQPEATQLVPTRVLLDQIRPEWQAKSLIQRVERILPVDPSSACQRLFNAAIHDLRQKILRVGVDLARDAARRHKLPPVERPEDITENYSTARIIDLAYRIGFLSRSEWRRLERCYQIRRDLEHEDDQYEAEVEDVVYVFKVCVQVVLSRDPVELIGLEDVKELVSSPEKTAPSAEFLRDYEHAPSVRQQQIIEHLYDVAINSKKADIIRQNSVDLLHNLSGLTKDPARIELAQYIQSRVGRGRLELVVAKVAHAAGVLPYLKQRQIRELFQWILERMKSAGYHWKKFRDHPKLLDDFEDVGGIRFCPRELRQDFLIWLVLCYIGEPGGYGRGVRRPVFYSDSAAPCIERMVKETTHDVRGFLENLDEDAQLRTRLTNKHVARRFEQLRDLVEETESNGDSQPDT